jgi:hypothetical protein
LKRREFIAGAMLAALYGSTSAQAKVLQKMMGGKKWRNLGLILSPIPDHLVYLNSKDLQFSSVKIPNQKPHALLVHPKKNHIALVIDQGDKNLTQVDLHAKKVMKNIQPSRGISFPAMECFPLMDPCFICPNIMKMQIRKGKSLFVMP